MMMYAVDYLENSVMRRWQFLTGDVSFQEYGGSWFREIAPRVYHVIELVNMVDAIGERDCERDNVDTYIVELKEIDLDEIDIEPALQCCGWENEPEPCIKMQIDACNLYGSFAPMGSASGNNYRLLLSEMKRQSRSIETDARHREALLERPVNKLGSTAREMARGDFKPAMIRGIVAGDMRARIIGKMHGLSEDDLDLIVELGGM